MSSNTVPVAIVNDKMLDEEKVARLVPQVIELSKNELSRLNVAMTTVFIHRYKGRFDYLLRQMVRAKAKEQILKSRALNQPKVIQFEPLVPAPIRTKPGSQLLLFG